MYGNSYQVASGVEDRELEFKNASGEYAKECWERWDAYRLHEIGHKSAHQAQSKWQVWVTPRTATRLLSERFFSFDRTVSAVRKDVPSWPLSWAPTKPWAAINHPLL